MSDKKVFMCMAGQVYLEKVYWHDSKDATLTGLANKLSLYSDEKRRKPVYMHLHVSDLFLNAGGDAQRVQKGTKIAIDILALSKDDMMKQKDANNTNAIKDSVEIFAECILDLEPGGKTIVEGINSGVVSGFEKSKTELMVIKFFNRGGTNANVAYMHDLSFEVQFTDEQYKKLFDKKNNKKYLFAWAWTINKQTKSEYKSVSDAEIDSAEKRLKFLKQGEKSYIDGLVDYCKEIINSSEYLPRHQYGATSFVDNFPFDEPSYNFLKVENALPFTFFAAGAQFGPVGLCKKDSEYHKKYISKGPGNEDIIVKKSKNVLDERATEFYLDEPCGLQDNGVRFGHGLSSDQGEYHSYGDQCFLFKKDSAALKINSIEQISNNEGSVTKAFTCSSGKCELVYHDYISDYRDKFKDIQLLNMDIVKEQEEVDFSTFKTVLFAPNESLYEKPPTQNNTSQSADKKLLARIEKEIPGYGFIGCCHTDVKLRGQKKNADEWEAHTLVHRPLIFMYELEKDLTEEETNALVATPITCKLLFGNVGRFKEAEYKIPIDTKEGVKQGKHAIFVYIVTTEPRIEVIITDDTHVPAVDRVAGYGEKAIFRGFSWPLTGLPSVTLYENQTDGLFEDNPVVIIDDFSWSDIITNSNKAALKAANKTINSTLVGFVTGFIPVFGAYGGTAWDIGVDMVDGVKLDTIKKATIQKNAMKLFLQDLQLASPPNAAPLDSSKKIAGGINKAIDVWMVFEKVNNAVKGYYDNVAKSNSQFLRGVDFGKGEKDSLYLLAVKTTTLTQDSKTFQYSKGDPINTIELFMNREVTGDDHPPFNVQLGDTAGLLQRNDKKAEDSVACLRDSYLQKVAFFQEILAMDTKDKKVGEYLVELAKQHAGRMDLLDKFAKANVNKKFRESLESKKLCDVLEKKANGGDLTTANAEMLCMIINLLRYVDVFFVTCPVCKHIVSLSWGWCPYHGTMEELKLEDVNGDGKFDDGFEKYLIKKSFDKMNFLDAYQKVIADRQPLFVHWTQFRISRGRG